MKYQVSILAMALLLVTSCREDDEILTPEEEKVSNGEKTTEIVGFYLLNEGNMGSNKSTLDYYDYTTGVYTRNIYAEANPTMAQALGDVGNDIQIYGSKLYAVMNSSNLVEVMDAKTAKHIGTIEVPNCRCLHFDGQYGYLTSYAGQEVSVGQNKEQRGYVAKFDTATLKIVDKCDVGFQPDELYIEKVNGKLYVANSGSYMVKNSENTISVIDLQSFTEAKRIEVVNNLHRLRADSHNQLWVSSRGDYYTQPSRLYCIDIATETVTDSVCVPVTDFDIVGDSLYVYSTEFSYLTYETTISYSVVNTKTHEIVSNKFITDGSDEKILMPYGIKINPQTKEIFITDAKDFVSPGMLYCYTLEGQLKWSVATGDIPAHIVFRYKE